MKSTLISIAVIHSRRFWVLLSNQNHCLKTLWMSKWINEQMKWCFFQCVRLAAFLDFPSDSEVKKAFVIPNQDELGQFSVYLSNNFAIHVPRKEEDRDLGKVFKNMSPDMPTVAQYVYNFLPGWILKLARLKNHSNFTSYTTSLWRCSWDWDSIGAWHTRDYLYGYIQRMSIWS